MLPYIWDISTYHLFQAIGIITIIIYYIITRNRYGLRWYVALLLGLIMVLVEHISAKIMFIIEIPSSLKNGISLTGGYSLFGMFFFGPLLLLAISLILKINCLDLFDYMIPVGLLELSFYRMGCMCAGCCYGIEVGWGISNGTNEGLFPVQPLEACLDFIAFLVIVILIKKNKLKRGEAFYITYLSYGAIRFVMEFFRERTNVVGVLATSHFYALGIMIFGIVMLIYSRRYKKIPSENKSI